MAVIKNIKRKTEITKKLTFSLETIVEELQKKYRMNGEDATAEWVENLEIENEAGEVENLGTCLVLTGVSVPRKKAEPVVEEAE